nr:uncharacterized protein LOC120819800 [Gasterosteus aculeatus aculeatus]
MKVHWVSCVLGFLCGPALRTMTGEAVGNNSSLLTTSQEPQSISLMRVNSSAEITCSTSLSDLRGLSLQQGFPEMKKIMYVDIKNRLVNKETRAAAFAGRVHVAPHQKIREGHSFTFRLSRLGPEDTNVYLCSWNFLKKDMSLIEKLHSPGTVVIIREKDPQEQCKGHMFDRILLDRILLALSVTGLFIVMILCIGALIVRRKRFQRRFRPAGAAIPPRPNRPQLVCPQHQVQHRPYTSLHSTDFRGILTC